MISPAANWQKNRLILSPIGGPVLAMKRGNKNDYEI